MKTKPARHFLLASDFDQTLSFNDSGFELSELLGVRNFEQKVAGLAHSHLVQQGGELAYLIRHDPEFRGVRREHLVEAGRRVRLKAGLQPFVDFLARGLDGHQFSFYVVSAAPREVVVSALDGIVPADHIFGTELDYDPDSGEVRAIQPRARRLRKGRGARRAAVRGSASRRIGVIYVGDGSSDIHVMLHVNNGDGFTIAVSDNRQLARIAQQHGAQRQRQQRAGAGARPGVGAAHVRDSRAARVDGPGAGRMAARPYGPRADPRVGAARLPRR